MKYSDLKSIKTTGDFKNSTTQASTNSLHLIDNEQYLGIDSSTDSLMKIKEIDHQYQFYLESYPFIIMLNPAYLMLFIDLTMSLILAGKHDIFLIEQSMQIGREGSKV